MAEISVLEDALIDKIAAGEVIERPASVIKEIVENAVDARATRIEIDLEEGGSRLISVQDNGRGIMADDLPFAVKRHATSKIKNLNDLFQIRTLGFRGEALASIAAVSRLSIKTRHIEEETGNKLEIDETGCQITPWNGKAGTCVTIRDLFYNVPARKKFLKTKNLEYAYCLEMIRALALSYPKVAFNIRHDGKEIGFWDHDGLPSEGEQNLKGEEALLTRLSAILPDGSGLKDYLYLSAKGRYCSIEALISPPGIEKHNAKHLYTFVNDRYVKDKNLRYSVLRGYHSHLLKGKFPVAVLYVYTDASLIDVNVHPAKTEVKFQYEGEVQNFIASAISQKIRERKWVLPSSPDSSWEPVVSPVESPKERVGATAWENLVSRPRTATFRSSEPDPVRIAWSPQTEGGGDAPIFSQLRQGYVGRGQDQESPPARVVASAQKTVSDIPWNELRFMGSFAKCYLFFEYGEQLLAVDQHAFHERILYESLAGNREMLTSSQALAVFETVVLSPGQVSLLVANKDALVALGFDVAPVGQDTIEVRAVPAILTGRNLDAALQGIAATLEASSGTSPSPRELNHDILASIACHSAVRSGEVLGEDDLETMLIEARNVDFYHNCPHGRRVFKWLSRSEVGKWFDRI
ncbi:MAG: DNA mismatch repair endonuclease MutL [Oligoflexales bacterium]